MCDKLIFDVHSDHLTILFCQINQLRDHGRNRQECNRSWCDSLSFLTPRRFVCSKTQNSQFISGGVAILPLPHDITAWCGKNIVFASIPITIQPALPVDDSVILMCEGLSQSKVLLHWVKESCLSKQKDQYKYSKRVASALCRKNAMNIDERHEDSYQKEDQW